MPSTCCASARKSAMLVGVEGAQHADHREHCRLCAEACMRCEEACLAEVAA
ncbi:four-helix bundle copper-binding protein [Hymenobacter sp. HSC-4F20]|uniref:four-helix bundle copper-binding protein n=1 Tax=Hymenobacter sp. HSC-4F20 TaxID=2864135 RepID=UPI0028774028|nr:four-helix bundle copper-binding protein [Hymenobacter sp. HSC-4F20]